MLHLIRCVQYAQILYENFININMFAYLLYNKGEKLSIYFLNIFNNCRNFCRGLANNFKIVYYFIVVSSGAKLSKNYREIVEKVDIVSGKGYNYA